MTRSTPMPVVNQTPDDWRPAHRPIASLISKSEKALQKVAVGTWPHTMLRDNLKALRIASTLMNRVSGFSDRFKRADLREALRALASMIRKTRKARAQFPPGTSQHTLQRNRLKALRLAAARIKTALSATPSDASTPTCARASVRVYWPKANGRKNRR